MTGDSGALEAGWTSPEIASPIAPIIVNGVVFTVSNGSPAVLHALDGATGKEIADLMFALHERARTTMFVVTHEQALARRCRRVVQLKDGRILSDERT